MSFFFLGSEDPNRSSPLDDSNQSSGSSACDSDSYTGTKQDSLSLPSPLPPPPSLWWYQLIGCRLKVRLYISVNKVMTVFFFFFVFVCFLLFLTPLLNMSLFGHASASCLLVVPCTRSVGDVHEDLGFFQ